jgi:hypothetical protein
MQLEAPTIFEFNCVKKSQKSIKPYKGLLKPGRLELFKVFFKQ